MAATLLKDVLADPARVFPNKTDFEKLLTAKLSYEAKQKTPQRDAWNRAHFNETPWGIAFNVSIGRYNKSMASYNKVARKGAQPVPKADIALKYLIVAIAIDWKELIDQLKKALTNWGYTTADLQNVADLAWRKRAQEIADICGSVHVTKLIEETNKEQAQDLTEAVEKHSTLNSKLFTKDEILKDIVRNKMLEIVDEFLADLKEQDIKIKVDDILMIGSNASYNYTKNSDIDLHILTNAKAANYDTEIAAALYGAYRTIFNKQLDITLYDIPLEVFVETEDSARVSNGVYSVKKNKWIKKPVAEDIPEYDTKALDKLVSEWEAKCKDLIEDIKADKLDDEKKVVKMLEDIYEKLRKKGIAKGEYSIENLTFKELRNKGYLDQLKDFRNELVSKRLSLEEELDKNTQLDMFNQLTEAALGNTPVIQEGRLFYIYNLKESDKNKVVQNLKKLHFVDELAAGDNGNYDFSQMLMTNLPTKYYDIRGIIKKHSN